MYEGVISGQYYTDIQGAALIDSPVIHDDTYVILSVIKEGYRTLGGESEFLILLSARDSTSDLRVSVVPSEILEGAQITVTVTDDIGVGVKDASIWKGSMELDEVTDTEGILVFAVPFVVLEREYFVYAVKQGYNYGEDSITIRKRSTDEPKLSFSLGPSVNESILFLVTVTDESHVPLQDVSVLFCSDQELTNDDGVASFVAPSVSQDTFYPVAANKIGYMPASTSVEVLNTGSSDGTSSQLSLSVTRSVNENDAFTVTVRNTEGFPISNARVTFLGVSSYTDVSGTVRFTAPDVTWDSTFDVLATKFGYGSVSAEIEIKNNQGFQYWYLVVVIVLIVMVGVFAYVRYRQYFK
jgi:hypothetical protein